MARTHQAGRRWSELNGQRAGFISRCEGYASVTVRKICLPDGYDQTSTALQHDWQSVGAQAVNHLSNKLMLALFAPSRPFARLDPSAALKQQLLESETPLSELEEALAAIEKDAVRELDQSASRPKLYEALKHLVVTGNVLMYLGKEGMRIIGIKHYCVKRDVEGKVLEILLRENVMFDELDEDIQREMFVHGYKEDQKIDLFKWIRRTENGKYELDTFVGNIKLSPKYSGTWTAEKLPYRALTWDLADSDDYGTGLVEDYNGDFQGLSKLSRAQIEGAILSSEYRWLANPAGMTRPEDITDSANGAVVPGTQGDLSLVQAEVGNSLNIQQSIGSDYIQRIGRGFLLASAVTRQAERVTAVEMRMQAEELETSLGGAYSRLAVDMQHPIFLWLLTRIKATINGKQLIPVIVTGLDALSRSGDLEDLQLWLNDMSALTQLPEAVQGLLNMAAVVSAMAAGRGIKSSQFLKTATQQQAEQSAQQTQAMAQEAQSAGIQAAAQQEAAQQSQVQE